MTTADVRANHLDATQLQRLVAAARRLASDFDQGVFLPLLEADVDSYLLHILLDQHAYPASELHQNARVLGLNARRFDLVAGRIDLEPASGERAAATNPELVVQGKFFPRWGFTAPQQNVHLGHVVDDDIPTLGQVRKRWPKTATCALLVDLYFTPNLRGYLSGRMGGRRRIDTIAEHCNAAGAALVWVHPDAECKTAVDVFNGIGQER